MGQEIDTMRFEPRHFNEFERRLRHETELLGEWMRSGRFSDRGPVAGFELEAWLVDREFEPACLNQAFMQVMDNPLVAPELAQFNVEFNNHPHPLLGRALSDMERELRGLWQRGVEAADACGAQLLSIGILPTLRRDHLAIEGLTPLNRYYALNEQLLRSRGGRPLQLDVSGSRELLRCQHPSMMLEAAGTSFQIHLQMPAADIHRLYNAALAASAPMVAVAANSPFLFGKDLWDESRIALFEQSLQVGDFGGAACSRTPRVSLGSGYVRASITECFTENLEHPPLLPMLFDSGPERLDHLRLHNGTMWRWNRPLIGFDADGRPHVRIEHRVLPGTPSIVDAVSDAAFFYGLVKSLSARDVRLESRLPFARVRENFHRVCRTGLDAKITWTDGKEIGVRDLLLQELLPLAHRGLSALAIAPAEADHYLGIVTRRVENGRNGAKWQREYCGRHGRDMRALTAAYLERQQSGAPVHTWPL